jgi:hypothetical protein
MLTREKLFPPPDTYPGAGRAPPTYFHYIAVYVLGIYAVSSTE